MPAKHRINKHWKRGFSLSNVGVKPRTIRKRKVMSGEKGVIYCDASGAMSTITIVDGERSITIHDNKFDGNIIKLESRAILAAVEYANENYKNESITIISDSMHSVNSIYNMIYFGESLHKVEKEVVDEMQYSSNKFEIIWKSRKVNVAGKKVEKYIEAMKR